MLKAIWFLASVTSRAYSAFEGDPNAKFLEQYVSQHEFQSLRYSVIACNRETGFELLREISSKHHGLAAIHKTEEELKNWVNKLEPQLFIGDLQCSEMQIVLQQANNLGLFRKPFQWLLLDLTKVKGKATGKGYWKVLESLDVLLDSDVKIAKRIDDRKIDIIGVYKYSVNGSIEKENLAGWSREYGFMIRDKECPANRRSNLRGMTITASLVLLYDDSLKHLEDLKNSHLDSISKVGHTMIKYLGEILNARIKFKIVKSIGEKQNTRWNGMIGDLESGESDLGATPALINPDLLSTIEYYAKITPSRCKFIFQSPPLSYSNNIFTLPFDRTVWYCCFGMIVASSLILYLAVKFENENMEKTDLPDIVKRLITKKKILQDSEVDNHVISQKVHNALEDKFSDIVMLNVGAICLQGTVVEPKGPSGRIIAIFLYFSYMFLYVSYSACIVALLQSSDTSIKTLMDLLRSPLHIGADIAEYSQNYFKTDPDPIRKEIYEKKVAPKGEPAHFLPVSEGIKNVREGLYAYHVDTNEGYREIERTYTEDEKCGLQELEISFFPNMDTYLTVKKYSPYEEIVKIGCRIKKILERGLESRAQRRIYTGKPVCGSKGSSFVSVGLVDCYPAFMVLLYGLGLALLIIIAEKFYKNKKKKIS